MPGARQNFGHEIMFRAMYHTETTCSKRHGFERRQGESEVNSNDKTNALKLLHQSKEQVINSVLVAKCLSPTSKDQYLFTQ